MVFPIVPSLSIHAYVAYSAAYHTSIVQAIINRLPRRSPAALGRFQLVLLFPRVSPRLTALVAVVVVITAVLPLAFTFASGQLIGAIPGAVADGPDSPASQAALRALALAGGIFVLQRLIGPLQGIFGLQLAGRVEDHLVERLMRAVSGPTGIGHLEDSATLDLIRNAQEIGSGRWRPHSATRALVTVASQWLQGFGYAAMLIAFQWWLGLAVLAAQLYVAHVLRREYIRNVDVIARSATVLRRATYLRDLALTPPHAKEVRLFGLVDWINDRHSDEWWATMRTLWRERNRGLPIQVAASLVMAAVHACALAYMGWKGVQGTLSLADLTVYAGALSGVRVLGSISPDTLTLEWGTATVPALRVLERHLPSLQAAQTPRGATRPSVDQAPARRAATAVPTTPPAPTAPPQGIHFEGVTFRYPGSHDDTLSELNLEIPAGRSLAIVGANGAGKTTLVKLLCRLYEPQAGRITADGVPIAALAPQEWRHRVSAIFQDFVRYHMPARDNVGFGALAHAGDQPRLDRAAELAGALDLVQRLPNGWDTILARHYKGGTDLSGGEWQRIALARALFAVNGGADVLILDEPTANLDVRAEAALYDRFLDITSGLTTILISHRFSTVRRAHRIVVLKGGRVVEQGSHEELLALRGRYAEMFTLQASRFTEEAQPA